MKKLIAFAACSFIISSSFAQNQNVITAKKLIAAKRCAIAGTITDMHRFPLKGAEAFIYQPDSSIIASGYADAQGHYETNSVLPGTYTVKIMYPNQKTCMVTGVVLKPGITQVNITADEPATDTSMPYADITPKPTGHKKVKK
jgi:Carboxypeptidase regulatory-like domain